MTALDGAGEPGPEQADVGVFGFWLFLMSDAVVFALLLATYGVMESATVGGPTPASVSKLGPAFFETILLLTSSFTYAMASVDAKDREPSGSMLGWLALTLALGLAFAAMELHDFSILFADGALPTRSGYLSAFFSLVPLHGLHVLFGCLWIAVMIAQSLIIGLDARVRLNLVRLGLFWHFLDIVWIVIVSVVYLQGLIA